MEQPLEVLLQDEDRGRERCERRRRRTSRSCAALAQEMAELSDERDQNEHAADRESRRRIHQVRMTGPRQLVGSLGSVRSDQPVRQLVCQL